MTTLNQAGNPILNLQRDVDPFTLAYIEAMFWTEANPDNEEMDGKDWTDLADETLARIVADCAKFQADNERDLCVSQSSNAREGGHCFWLSRNGHGSGFFDSEHFANDTRERLQDAARACGEVNLYVGDDGKIYA